VQAERLILETDSAGNVKNLPKLPPNTRLELIFLVLEESGSLPARRRQPHPDIAGRVKILGDVISTVPATDWDLPT
jgi:hypothetical protein